MEAVTLPGGIQARLVVWTCIVQNGSGLGPATLIQGVNSKPLVKIKSGR